MKILVLDDSKERLSQFKQRLIGHDICCVETASETISKLKDETWDIVFLDHDLGGTAYVASGKGTGYEVAEWLRDNPDRKPEKIIIHSFNAPGAQNMQYVLPGSIYNPGAWINRDMGF